MECAVITTYRCNAKCQMCETWKNPSSKAKEFHPEILKKIPAGMTRLNITGGEPILRDDIDQIVTVLNDKTDRLEISTNGYFTSKIVKIAEQYPNITVRVSIEGLPRMNDRLRGIKNGFDHGLRTILRLKTMGVRDIGFAMTISGENCLELIDLYTLVSSMEVEFANAVVHNSFYFHKMDNKIENKNEFEIKMLEFIEALLKSPRKKIKKKVKDWFRAYLNLGLLNYVKGEPRKIACGAGTDTFFIDPYGHILACNGSDHPLVMGDLTTQNFDEIWHSEKAVAVRKLVANCHKNCWMTGTAVPAMRRNILKPIFWVTMNKMRLLMGKSVRL